MQIIVADDDSSPDVVDFAHFPGSDRADVEILFTKEGREPVMPVIADLPEPKQMAGICGCR